MPLHLRLLPPRSYRLRHQPPEWEVTDDEGKVVGWIEQHSIPTASRPFYNLTALHPVTGERIPLELSADLDERLAKLQSFLVNPDSCAQHYPSASEAWKAWRASRPVPGWELNGGRSGRHG